MEGSGRFRLRSCGFDIEACDDGAVDGADVEAPGTVRLLATLEEDEVSVDLKALIWFSRNFEDCDIFGLVCEDMKELNCY